MDNREHAISTVTVWGAIGNVVLCVFKAVAGILGKSSAMVADAVHSLSDLVSDIVVLVMVRIASKGKDKSHDYGHGKFETLATVAVSLLLLVVGAKLMVGAIERIRFASGGGTLEAPGTIALWAALVSIAVKEFLYQWTARVGKRVDSPAMIANAWHHRSDALSSVGSALGIGGAILLGGKWTILDPIVGAVISIVIIVVAVKMSIPAINELTEASLPDETEERILSIFRSVPGIDNVHDLRTRRSGPDIIIDVHIVVDPEMTVAAAHDITAEAESTIRQEFGAGTQISIHVEPNEDSD
ncbi:MAG: cation diffusion facilitator family transporter [Bacteroidia bacterium]|nr:cation diffusion facilitator family transporter [Bacteroidia bacterium]